jgi:hypothetical protein
MSSETETQLVSVERVIQYLDIAVEAPPLIPHTAPPPDWPREGAITMSHLKLRYRYLSLSLSLARSLPPHPTRPAPVHACPPPVVVIRRRRRREGGVANRH